MNILYKPQRLDQIQVGELMQSHERLQDLQVHFLPK